MRVLSILVTVSFLAITPFQSLLAQECGEGDSALSVAEVLDGLNTKCCSKKKKLKRKLCLANQERSMRKANKWLGSEFATDARGEINELRTSSCEDTEYDVEGKTCTEVNVDTMTQTISDSCCGRTKRRDRIACLKNSRRALSKVRRSMGGPLSSAMNAAIKTLTRADSCGKGGEGTLIPAACGGKVRKNSDGGLGGWLHKPHSDNTGSIVNLFPSEDSPSGCGYYKKSGKKFMDALSTGRANGNRVHVRPVQNLSCSSFPRNMYLACKVNGRRLCYNIPDPCNRYD